MRTSVTILFLLIITGLSTMISCNKDYLIPAISIIPDTVSFSTDIIPIFNQSCNGSGCHANGGIAPDLTAEKAYDNLLLYALVDTANAELSILYFRLNSAASPMPPAGKLLQDKIDLVLYWIDQGAINN